VAEWWQCRRATILWWLPAVGLATALKWHFSAAEAADIGWMLQPLALLLRLATGWHFRRNAQGEWPSLDAGIVLIKACAGINFMILSFLGWCWLSRPRGGTPRWSTASLEWPLLLGGALVYAWLTTLLVNLLRILAIVHWQGALQHWLPAPDAHRLLGLLVYLPSLGLQWMLSEPRRRGRALLMAVALYALLMLGVPLLTGNAAANRTAYRAQALAVLAVLLPLTAAGCWWRWRRDPGSGLGAAAEGLGQGLDERVRLVERPLEGGAPQVGVGEIGAAQVGGGEVRLPQRGAGESRAVQQGGGEIGVLGRGAGQVGAGEIGAHQLGVDQHAAQAVAVAQRPAGQVDALHEDVLEVGLAEVGLTGARADQIGAEQVGAAERRPAEVGAIEARVEQVGVAQVRADERCILEVRPLGIDAREIRAAEVGAAQVGVLQLGAAQPGTVQVATGEHPAREIAAGEIGAGPQQAAVAGRCRRGQQAAAEQQPLP
jgi:exosortase K